jgi:parallel beta-helix repeat protein
MITDLRTMVVAALIAVLSGCGPSTTIKSNPGGDKTAANVVRIQPGDKVQEDTQKALIEAKPGTVIEFAAGKFDFTAGLSLAKEGVTLRGQGMDKTFLSFKNQTSGKEGLLVTRGKFVIEDLTVEDTKGDAIKVNDVNGVTFRRVQARWNGGGKESNGAYGLYPVQCRDVLIEDCVAVAASDAGIYVGQSENIIVRGCKAYENVAGIEIENSLHADVYNNETTNNAGGLLVFDLPGLQVKNGRHVRVYKNRVHDNNHDNFAPKGNRVAKVPPGTGLMVMATDEVEVFQNTIENNQTYNLAVVSYYITLEKIEEKDKAYDPIPESIYVHDNQFATGGAKPAGEFGQLLKAMLGAPLPDIIYDGVLPSKGGSPRQELYLKNNGQATFANLHWGELMPALQGLTDKAAIIMKLALHKAKVERDIKPYEGELQPLAPVQISGAN